MIADLGFLCDPIVPHGTIGGVLSGSGGVLSALNGFLGSRGGFGVDWWVGVDLGGGWSDTGRVRRDDDSVRASAAPPKDGGADSHDQRRAETWTESEFGSESESESGSEFGSGSGSDFGMDSAVSSGVELGVDRIGAGLADLDLELGADRDGAGDDVGLLGARMFAHEVNNLALSISGRAQRGLLSGDEDHVRAALEAAADVGSRVAGLCALFMEREAVGVADRKISLEESQVVSVHEFARSCVSCHPVLMTGDERLGGVFEVVLGPGVFGGVGGRGIGGVPMPGMLLGQVLVNLYGNALTGIGRLSETDGVARGARIRLGGGAVAGGGVELVVEDSGVGFDDGGFGGSGRREKGRGAGGSAFGGYGVGLGVCRALVGGFGGRVELGRSVDFGGGLVRLTFVG